MKKNCICRIGALLLALVLLLSLSLPARAATVPDAQLKTTPIGRSDHGFYEAKDFLNAPKAPDIGAEAAILVELNSGTVVYEKNIHERLYPASITKVMTTLLAIENIPFTDTITLSHASVTDLEDGGYDYRFYEGETFSARDGFYAFFLESVNTIGHAIAEHLDGSVAVFADRMNARAKELGAVDTSFRNPHGLNTYWPEHLTSAHDMAKILWGAIENDTFRQLAGTPAATLTDGKGNVLNLSHGFQVFRPDTARYDKRAVAGKTGYTNAAGYTRVLYAKEGDLDYIAVVMRCSSTAMAYDDVTKLLDYGFGNFTLTEKPTRAAAEAFLPDLEEERAWLSLESDPAAYNNGRLLVPKASAGQEWKGALVTDGNGLKLSLTLDGAELASCSVTLEIEEPEPASTEQETKPGSTKKQKESKASTERQTADPSASAEGSTEGAGEDEDGSAGLIIGLIAVSVLLFLALGAIMILALQNRALKQKMRRRSRIKREE